METSWLIVEVCICSTGGVTIRRFIQRHADLTEFQSAPPPPIHCSNVPSACAETLAIINLCKQQYLVVSHIRVLTGSCVWQADATYRPWSSIVKAPFLCLPDYADLGSMLLRPLATPKINFDCCAGLVTVNTNGQLSSGDGSTRDFGNVQIMGLRSGTPVLWFVCDIPYSVVVVEVSPSWTGDMHNLIGQQMV